jgi:hypothetical protein
MDCQDAKDETRKSPPALSFCHAPPSDFQTDCLCTDSLFRVMTDDVSLFLGFSPGLKPCDAGIA